MGFLVPPVVAPGTMRDAPQPAFDIGDGITARPLRSSDSPWVAEAFTDPLIRRWHLRQFSIDDADSWIRESAARWTAEEGANWAVVDADDAPLGRLGLHGVSLSFGVAEIGYWVLPHARRRGVGTASVNALSSWALDNLGLHRLELCHSVENEPSCTIAGQTGYGFEGIKRSALKHLDGWHDMHLHARLASNTAG